MWDAETRFWNSTRFYKGYLPTKDAAVAQSYVILARKAENPKEDGLPLLTPSPGQKGEEMPSCTPKSTPQTRARSPAEEVFLPPSYSETLLRNGADDVNSGPNSPPLNRYGSSDQVLSPANRITPETQRSGTGANNPLAFLPENFPSFPSYGRPSPSSRPADLMATARSMESDDSTAVWNDSTGALPAKVKQTAVEFYVFKKCDVTPPPLKYIISPKKVNRCFVLCEKPKCSCECPHVKPNAWRLRVDQLRIPSALTVSDNGQHRRLDPGDISLTAGYVFALGLMEMKAVNAVVPNMCRFNKDCRNGCSCLYIHADVSPRVPAKQAAEIRLADWARTARMIAFDDGDQQKQFFQFLESEGVTTVGDLQVLGVAAFESLANRIPPAWAEAFLIVSVLRNFDPKSSLQDVLPMFPRVKQPIMLPPFLERVDQLLEVPTSELYRLELAPHIINACEMIRARYEPEDEYSVITLAKEPKNSFFVLVTEIIEKFRSNNAHCSWRKHDARRPVVTSVFTFVDVTMCSCGSTKAEEKAFASEEAQVRSLVPTSPRVANPLLPEIGIPANSWCRCPRHYEIAVNYELSTPSGSRCSEQNAMGKLASMGVPTWAVREVFVHGTNHSKEANPLFPCGVCENMLQKVTKDVTSRYGEDVVLYMFDATIPRKIVFLPVPEISHRDGSSFKKFVARDLRDR